MGERFQEQPSNKSATLVKALQRAQKKRLQKKGVVPFLGTFLTELVMLDTAMEDYLEPHGYPVSLGAVAHLRDERGEAAVRPRLPVPKTGEAAELPEGKAA
ncbi:uncharacterized protein LOC123786485 isoform X4 [Ursus americanus]|uniref:uncharacterized protein LOC123786485 isoform X4 n=1 Tax=Ursus americanus TaxID=9643 RepID=UPI001E679FAD|nr:uncharacterized protein LOC123786485 isoform X4 [Ursus americanus]